MEIQNMENDPLWKTAKKRAAFKIHLVNYIVWNSFMWAVWYFTGAGYMWPIWSMLGWGVGLIYNYLAVYEFDKSTLVKKEYDRLKNQSRS
ncbi:MAG: hypothetical protein JWO06_2283 [Bacteroidota bacterium]|nr:hypothetical protein [Bacteroidota bacterium]